VAKAGSGPRLERRGYRTNSARCGGRGNTVSGSMMTATRTHTCQERLAPICISSATNRPNSRAADSVSNRLFERVMRSKGRRPAQPRALPQTPRGPRPNAAPATPSVRLH